jgi:hypothetical protein
MASRAASLHDLHSYFSTVSPSSRARLLEGFVKFADAVTIIKILTGEHGGDNVALSNLTIRRRISLGIEAYFDAGLCPANTFPRVLLCKVLDDLCSLTLLVSELDMIFGTISPQVPLPQQPPPLPLLLLQLPPPAGRNGDADDDDDIDDGVVVPHSALEYVNYAKEELVTLIGQRDDCIVQYQAELKSKRDNVNKLQKRCNKLGAKIATLELDHDNLVAVTNFRPAERLVSLYGGYSLATRRRHGYVGVSALMSLSTAEDYQGGFSSGSRKIVPRFEERAVLAHRLISAEFHQFRSRLIVQYDPTDADDEVPSDHSDADAEIDLDDMEAHFPTRRRPQQHNFLGVSYSGDATHQQALEKSKVFLGHATSLICSASEGSRFDALNPTGSNLAAVLETISAASRRNFCDIQKVQHGTGGETHAIIDKQLQSISAPTVETACCDFEDAPILHWAVQVVRLLTIFVFNFDSGGDNKAATRMMVDRAKNVSSIIILLLWCVLHQYHLIIKGLLVCIENFDWGPGDSPPGSPPPYFTSLSGISNVWRSPGMAIVIQKKAMDLYQDESFVQEHFGKIPRKCIKSRWGSIEGVETFMVKSLRYVANVFVALFATFFEQHRKRLLQRAARAQPGADEENEYRKQQRLVTYGTTPFNYE